MCNLMLRVIKPLFVAVRVSAVPLFIIIIIIDALITTAVCSPILRTVMKRDLSPPVLKQHIHQSSELDGS